jgi:endonuclease/exonuclease/phosphatase (EEP) superfamily protein YafD
VQGSLVVTLADSLSGRTIVLGCTHLKAKAGAEEEVVRGRQAAEAAARVVRAGEKAGRNPVLLLAGDFNAGPGTAAARAPASVGLASVWETNPWPWSTFKYRTAGVGKEAAAGPKASRALVDHIFFRGAALDARWPALPEEAVPEGLPCAAYPSDHVAIVVRWRL